ncbi:MAG: hypothetical protein ABJC89_20680, partial [Acidobacteriota bacterium]
MTGPKDPPGHDAEMPAETAAAMERRLLDAFAAHHAVPHASGRQSQAAPARRAGPSWIAAAAAVIVIAGTVAGWRALRGIESPSSAAASVTTRESQPARAAGSRTQDSGSRILDSGPHVLGPESRAPHPAQPSRRPPRPSPRAEQPSGFIALPGAAGMPQFESGTIVRMDVPVASLPAYGVDISRADGNGAVEADFLVAQDGQARAIRLVTNQNSSARSG